MATLIAPTIAHTVSQLWDEAGVTATIHPMPAGSPVDGCTWCQLADPAPAVVQFAGTATRDTCLGCAVTAARSAVEEARGAGDAERIHAEILDIPAPSILPMIDDTVMAVQPAIVAGPLADGDLCDIVIGFGRHRRYCHLTGVVEAVDADGRHRILCAGCADHYFPAGAA